MPSRENIIDNVEQYSARDLHSYIKQGILTFDELCQETAGYLSADVRKELEKLLEDTPTPEETVTVATPPPFEAAPPEPEMQDDWALVDKTDEEALKLFIATHPGHPMIREANRLRNEIFTAYHVTHDIDTLKNEISDIMTNPVYLNKGDKILETIKEYFDKGYATVGEFLRLLAEDNNLVNSYVVKNLIDDYYFTYQDLAEIGINQKFIDYLMKDRTTTQPLIPAPIDRINKVSTEVYFWGIPSSGKTCALGGILSMANNGHVVTTMSQDNDSQGYGYMTRLANVFNENQSVGTLPPGTGIYDIWEMGFDLEDTNGRVHPITCIDLAGELVRCMYKSDAGDQLSEDEMSTLETVTNLLVNNRTTNRKMHFFVLEYGGEERTYEGLGQAVYLQAAFEYIKRTKIFDKETDGVFLLFTKVDKTKLRGQELVNHLVEYTSKYYSNFYNKLVGICKDNEINGGKVERLPFTLGTVCFQDFCMFDGKAAENVVKQILNRSKGFKKGKLQKFINKVKG